jgi:hypothetical protein
MSGMDAAPDLWSVAEVVHDDGQVTTLQPSRSRASETAPVSSRDRRSVTVMTLPLSSRRRTIST